MKKCAVVLLLIALCMTVSPETRADDAKTIAAVAAAAMAIDDAFQRRDVQYIKEHMTPDHLSTFPAWDGPLALPELLASVPHLNMKVTSLSQQHITILGPGVATRTAIMGLEGDYAGKPLPARVFITEIIVKRGSKWLEQSYQATILRP